MKTTKTTLALNRVLNFVNFSAALLVAVLFFLPLRNFKIGVSKPAANLTTLALDSDVSFAVAPPFYFENVSDSCVALWAHQYLVPLEYPCRKPVVDANNRKLLPDALGFPWNDNQDFLDRCCPGTDAYIPNHHHPVLEHRQCLLAQWDVDRILPQPIYSPNVGESCWLCDPAWMHEFKGYIYTFLQHSN